LKNVFFRVTIFIFALCFSSQAFAQEQSRANKRTRVFPGLYELEKTPCGGFMITAYLGRSEDVEIPRALIEKTPLVAIGSSAFFRKGLTSVIIPPTITSIGSNAFSFNQLTEITIPNSVTEIGGSSLYKNNLTFIVIPEGVKFIDSLTFARNPLTSITLGANVELANDPKYAGFGVFGKDMSFHNAYEAEGKAAGTYTRANAESSEWTLEKK
jgi:hypothetical protein